MFDPQCLMHQAGYMQDRFVAHFVAKPTKRLPMINRGAQQWGSNKSPRFTAAGWRDVAGYFARVKGLELLVAQFFELHGGVPTSSMRFEHGLTSCYDRLFVASCQVRGNVRWWL